MADVLLPATSGRAKCRGCGATIRTGELRFGESLPNAYGEGDAFHWFHVPCAALMRPEKFAPALAASDADVADREWLAATAEVGKAFPRLCRLAYAERSKSGKARCRSCRDTIDGGVMRLALQMFDEGRMSPMGFIHVECANNYLGTTDIVERAKRLSPSLDDAAIAELSERLLHQRAPLEKDDEASEPAAERDGPELAKAHPPAESDPRRVENS
ncbi:MAG TPA: hypothetical protein VH062_29390 [Polyangiaceae bacterium]|jgi:hypothetical protein|nr:hypothetical protein [Polyangiaceae bacterium]